MPTQERTHSSKIDNDIRVARTLPAEFYKSQSVFEAAKDKIFARTWQFAGDTDSLKAPGHALPFTLLDGYLNEPLLFTRDSDSKIHCLSNVCTHRGLLLVEGECHSQGFRCRYHGRRFGLDGCFLSTPGFDDAQGFPSKEDNLPKVPFGTWDKFMFTSINPAFELDEVLADMKRRLGWLPLHEFMFAPKLSRDYIVKANWALYCDNYLEGFHVPYVHPDLAVLLDCKQYRTEVFKYCNLQIGPAAKPEDSFNLPKDSPEYGQNIAAYYYWLFPNMMFNFYPWGLSVNIVIPQAVDRARVRFLTYLWDESRMAMYSTSDIDRTEREDEDVVEGVQKGISSRFYNTGRYSPQWETGVHHFHTLLTEFLGGST